MTPLTLNPSLAVGQFFESRVFHLLSQHRGCPVLFMPLLNLFMRRLE